MKKSNSFLTHENSSLRQEYGQDPNIYRFFSCSAFEIYFKVLISDLKIDSFFFTNKGSRLVSLLLNSLGDKLIGKERLEWYSVIKQFEKDEVDYHLYLTTMDKRRFQNFLTHLINYLQCPKDS